MLKRLKPIHYLLIGVFITYFYFFITHPGTNFVVPKGADEFKQEAVKHGSRDAYLYSKMAFQLMEHGVYGYDTEQTDEIVKNAFVPPSQPFYLVICFTIAKLLFLDYLAVTKFINLLLSVFTVLIIYLIGQRLFNSWVGLIAAALYGSYFSGYHFFRTLLTETPAMFFFFLSVFLFIKAYQENRVKDHVLFGIIFSIAIMFRPTPAPLILLAIALIVYRYPLKEIFKIALLWAIGPLVVIAPWVVRNFLAFDSFILFASERGDSWFAGTNPFYLENPSDIYREMYRLKMDKQEYAFYRIMRGFDEQFGLWLSWFTVGKAYELFKLADGSYFYPYAWMKWFKLQHVFVISSGILSALFFHRKNELMWVALLLLGYIGVSNLFLTIPRYGFYIIPVFCILAAYGIYSVVQLVEAKIKSVDKITSYLKSR